MHDRGTYHNLTEEKCAAIWWTGRSPLPEAALSQLNIYCVCNAQAAIHALQQGLASCVVIETDPQDPGREALIETIRARWPGVGIVVLASEGTVSPPEGGPADHYVSREKAAERLPAIFREMAARHAEQNDYATLQERTRHLEGLLSGALTPSGAVKVDKVDVILGDLREAGRTAVDADDVAVLMADSRYDDLTDALNLGVPGQYLNVCREHFRSLSPSNRLDYLGDEVLLRERLPDQPPESFRVREAEAAGAASYMRIPITIDQRLVGFVGLFAQIPNRFNGAHLQLGRLFAAQVATAIRNRDLYVRLNRAEQYQQAISQIARLLAEDLTLSAVLDHIVQEAVRLVSGQAGVVFLVEPDDRLRISAVHDLPSDWLGERVKPESGQTGIIIATGQPSIVGDYRNWSHADPAYRDNIPSDCDLLGVPLKYRNRVLGVLQVIRRKDTPDAVETALEGLMMLAPQAATAIAKARLHETALQDRRQLQVMLDHTPAAVIMCDANGAIQIVNPEAERLLKLLDLTVDAVKGRKVRDLIAEIAPDAMIDVLEIPCAVEVMMGRAGEFMVHIAPITDSAGEVSGYVGVAQDVMQMRRMDRMKSNLNRVLTHDLGNLLMLARNPLELIDDPELRPAQRDQLKHMLTGSIARMETLLKDVMDLDLLPSFDQHTVTPYQLETLAKQAVERNQDTAHRAGIKLAFTEREPLPNPLRGHEVLIMQAIDNLVINAIKYTPAGGEVTVTTGVEGDFAIVQVIDNGYGIPADKLEAIFEPFVRVRDPRTAHIQGTGIGLNLVKTFVEAHNGRVSAKSELNKGSTFTIYLPFDPVQTIQSPVRTLTRIDLSSLINGTPRK
jgi:PAS domain S-box-containing protein